ncbi:hypothetical protein [Desulfoscipio geothermicus]|uniref:hypothetical protein n=1 Tax=Desulfoscipio geothermicus TaxID=39060 RepID=UPI0013F4C463|nr:hypothetical protein [Desulfoscipio geothermicus]
MKLHLSFTPAKLYHNGQWQKMHKGDRLFFQDNFTSKRGQATFHGNIYRKK